MKEANMRFAMRILPAALLGLGSASAVAAGLQLLEQNASGLGNAYAGSAAVAEDASTVFFNPAGMAYLPQGKKALSVGVTAIKPSVKFSNSGSTPPALQTLGNNNGGDAGDLAFLPNVYFALPVTERISFGLGIGAPFGLKTEYDSDWIGRFQGIKSDVKTLNLNPSLSLKLNDAVALGLGLDYQKLDAELTSAVNISGALCTNPALAALCGTGSLSNLAGTAKVSGDDTAWGYNFGAIFQVSPNTRIGVSYRSAIKYHVTGNVSFARPTIVAGGLITPGTAALLNAGVAAATPDGPAKLDIKLPDILIVSAYQKLNDRWEMLGDLSWTGWAKIQSLDIFRTSGAVLSSTPEHWRNTMRVAFGGIYTANDRMKWRFGLAYDQSPVTDQFRTVRLPDNNRTWISVGAQYALSKDSNLDWGYTHIFVKDGSINNNGGNAAAFGLVKGNYSNDVNMFGMQYSLAF